MVFHLNDAEDIKIIDKDNGFQDIIINGINYQQKDGTIKKVNITLPNVKLNLKEKTLMAYANEIDKSLWTLELEDAAIQSNNALDQAKEE